MSSTYCTNPISNILAGASTDADNSIYTSVPTWAENTHFANAIKCVVGTDGTDIYYFTALIVASSAAGYNQYLYWDIGTGWHTMGSGGTPAMRKSSSIVASPTNTDIFVNNNKVQSTEGFVMLNATVRVPI